MSKQSEQLLILYKQVLSVSNEIKTHIANADLDEALSREAYKTSLINKINLVKKNINLNSDEKSVINQIITEIQTSENENLSVLEKLKDETAHHLKILNKKEKLNAKYSQETNEESSILDISD